GGKFLHAGPGYGGSCFPKDTLALSKTARDYGSPMTIVDTVVLSNDRRKKSMVERIAKACGGSVEGKTIAVLGLTFKPNTDDMRESPSLAIVPGLQKLGATVRAYDPEGMDEARAMLKKVAFCNDAYDCMTGAHAAVIVTEWDQFRALDLGQVAKLLKDRVFIDLRNIYRKEEVAGTGLHY
ncbi:MAG: UDP-glucose/GDP-mannose dehydrogenase family protein, partial [Gammaproteobacteria bacterium]|nr:UDP-glucose/GDP-mannose dehydrogenase family protein [Gammaproteobacteria bacterium]